MVVDLLRGKDPLALRQIPRRTIHEFLRYYAVLDDLLLSVDIGEEGIQRPGTLGKPLLELSEFLFFQNSRDRVKRKETF